jgi:hypothetical protein
MRILIMGEEPTVSYSSTLVHSIESRFEAALVEQANMCEVSTLTPADEVVRAVDAYVVARREARN